ncbi:MAG: heavy metal-binding domain-containing protein [Micromonosporaceae bacterium]|nr:heavy metal-binding domain-containing protein [Micromonosporaceae bacterium]
MTVDPEGGNWTPEQIAQGSATEIEAGRLPLRAQWRIREQRARRDRGEPGSFTSDLTVEEFAAIRSVGFSPVGQVLGSAVFQVGWSYTGCGYYYGGFGSYGPALAPVVPVPATQQLLSQARHRAVQRMTQECEGLGGDGVVGVRLSVRSFYGNGLEFMAIGTAVRADGDKRPGRPFTSDLTGQDFARLIRAGWVPAALVQGVGAVIRHDDFATRSQRMSWTNQELVGPTQLLHAARDAARASLAADARDRGGHTVLLRDMQVQTFRLRCTSGTEGEDDLADVFLWGTAVVPFETSASLEAPLPMLRLSEGTR